jgi:hypothetical protein
VRLALLFILHRHAYLFFCPCLVFVLWSFVLSFDYPSLEISVSLYRSVNLVFFFLIVRMDISRFL